MTSQYNHELALMRALHHLQELEREATGWIEGNNYLVIHEFQGVGGDYVISVDQVVPPESEPLSVLAGDCLHNLSSSLNFLAYDLALAHTNPLPDKAADEIEFPIFGDVDRQGQAGMGPRLFRKSAPKRIRSMAPGAQTEIEGLQPYNRGNAFTEAPLWRLHELARFNRHRFLHPAVAASSGMLLNHAMSSNAILGREGGWRLQVKGGFVEGRTEVARFPVQPIDPSKEVYVDAGPALDIAFAKGAPVVAGAPMVKILSEVYNHIAAVVVPPLVPYLA